MAELSVVNLHFNFGEKAILSDLNFTIQKGEVAVIIGHSGAGKSTLLKILAGILTPSSGEVFWCGKNVHQPKNLVPGHPKIARIAQDFELMPHISAVENIYRGALHLLDEEKEALGSELLAVFGLENVAHQPAKTLSGGEQQRIAIAKAMAANPEVLVFDEAFSQLDLATKAMVLVRLKRYVKQKKRTAIFVLHDPLDAFYLADVVMVLHQGSIVQKDNIEAVYNKSTSSHVAKLFGPINKMSVLRAKKLFPLVWQNFNLEKRQVWFRPHMAKNTDLAVEFKVVNELFYGKTTLLQLKVDDLEIWLED